MSVDTAFVKQFDGLDAVAGALSQEPIRIAVGVQKGTRKNWSPQAKIFKAKT